MRHFQRIICVVAMLFIKSSADLQNRTRATTCVCTTVPCPVVGSNKLSTKGGSIGTYVYSAHNGVAVVTSAKITIKPTDRDTGSETTSCTQAYSRALDDDGVKDCDAGHILGNRLGGLGNQPINIFPQDLSVNRGPYREFEDDIYACLQSSSSASLAWSFIYASTSATKPTDVHYTVTYSGGVCSTASESFPN